jgi:hypothetical protein
MMKCNLVHRLMCWAVGKWEGNRILLQFIIIIIIIIINHNYFNIFLKLIIYVQIASPLNLSDITSKVHISSFH